MQGRKPNWISLVFLVGVACCVSGCGAKEEQKKRPPPLVGAAMPVKHQFVDQIEAVGTARANEQVTISTTVTERLERVLFTDGMAVRQGQLLAVLSAAQENAGLNGARAAEVQATAQLERVSNLYERGFATRTLLDQQQAAAAGARANAAEARAAISDRMIRAPFSGFTGLRTISEGAIVATGTPLVTISDISRIKLDFTVPETRLGALRIGQSVEAMAAAFPDQPIIGRITTIDPVIDPSTRAVLVRAILPNRGSLLKPGMLMNVRVQVGERTSDAVPEVAVSGNGAERFVYILAEKGKAKKVTVQTGLRDDGLIEVTGIPAGAKVITDGVVKVSEGMTVRLAGERGKRGSGKPPGAGPRSGVGAGAGAQAGSGQKSAP